MSFIYILGINVALVKNVLQQPVKALILRSYGVGNAPQDKQLLDTLKQANDNGIIIVNCSQCIKGKVNMGGYATGSALSRCGIVSGQDMTLEAALTKLHYLLSKNLSQDENSSANAAKFTGELSL